MEFERSVHQKASGFARMRVNARSSLGEIFVAKNNLATSEVALYQTPDILGKF